MNTACHTLGIQALLFLTFSLLSPSFSATCPSSRSSSNPREGLSRADVGGEGQPGPCCLAAASGKKKLGPPPLTQLVGVGPGPSAPPKLLGPQTCPALSPGQPILILEGKVQPGGHCPDEKRRPERWVGTNRLSLGVWRPGTACLYTSPHRPGPSSILEKPQSNLRTFPNATS